MLLWTLHMFCILIHYFLCTCVQLYCVCLFIRVFVHWSALHQPHKCPKRHCGSAVRHWQREREMEVWGIKNTRRHTHTDTCPRHLQRVALLHALHLKMRTTALLFSSTYIPAITSVGVDGDGATAVLLLQWEAWYYHTEMTRILKRKLTMAFLFFWV